MFHAKNRRQTNLLGGAHENIGALIIGQGLWGIGFIMTQPSKGSLPGG